MKTVSRDAQIGRERRRGNADDPGSIQHYAGFSKELGLFVTMRVREGKILSVGLTEEPPEDASTGGHPFLSRILEHIATGKDDMRDMPLDLDVTPFERQVLEALRDIPPGRGRDLWRHSAQDRPAESISGSGSCMRDQSRHSGGALPSGGAFLWRIG